jgi:hydroxymethylpyrimidine/phosphomethylpyrimidine kinase
LKANDPTSQGRKAICALTVASSDSGAGAGIQADLKAFAAHGIYGLSAIAGITAQNTQGVLAELYLGRGLLTSQLKALSQDFRVSAIKVGLLGTEANALALRDFLAKGSFGDAPVVLDPVMCSATGHTFLKPAAVRGVIKLFGKAFLITPNMFEAAALSGRKVLKFEDFLEAAKTLISSGAKNVLVKGGHLKSEPKDLLLTQEGQVVVFSGRRVKTNNDHGTGCTLSSAIAARLATGMGLVDAIRHAKEYVANAMEQGPAVGRGHGPLDHFYAFRDRPFARLGDETGLVDVSYEGHAKD